MSNALPPVHSLAEVAQALGETEWYVADKCRKRVWPHMRGARGTPSFTDAQYLQILELRSQPAVESEPQRIAFAPRSRKSA